MRNNEVMNVLAYLLKELAAEGEVFIPDEVRENGPGGELQSMEDPLANGLLLRWRAGPDIVAGEVVPEQDAIPGLILEIEERK